MLRKELRQLLALNRVNPDTSALTCEWDPEAEMFAVCRPSGDFIAHIHEHEKRHFKRLINK